MSNKNYLITILILVFLFLSVNASAAMLIPANEKAKEQSPAPEKSPAIGQNWDLERIDFIHYLKPEKTEEPAKSASSKSACYKLMGVKWSTLPVSYVINPTNPQGLSDDFISSILSQSAETWDKTTSKELFNNLYAIDNSARFGIYDGINAIVFDDYSNNNVIAITSVWYNKATKQIVEFDLLFNTRFPWGDALLNPNLMDLENIATHELGHSVGLADLYGLLCSPVTMYGYSWFGEIEKRTLEQADIMGLQKIYGL